MRVFRVIRSLNPAGGGPIFGLLQSIPYYTNLGIHTSVICFDAPSSPWLRNHSFPIFALGPVIGSYGYHPRILSSLKHLLAQADAVIVEGIWQYHAFSTWLALRESNVPYYVYPHGMLDPWFNRNKPFKRLKKAIYWLFFEQFLFRDAAGILFTTDQECFLSRTSFSPYQVHEFVVGYGAAKPVHPTNTEISDFLTRYPDLRNKSIYLFLGRLHPKKGLDLLIQSFATILSVTPSAHLVLAGPISLSYQRFLKELIQSLDISPSVTFCGHLQGANKYSAYSTADVFCLPSHQENFGVSVAEALSYGLPVIISDQVNIHEYVTQANAGFVHRDNLEATTSALLKWALMSQESRFKMSCNASTLFRKHFDWEVVSLGLSHLLESHYFRT